MPVQDTGKELFSQKREIVNVAVSRAKKELCVITSSIWMSEALQRDLTGCYIDNSRAGDQCYIRDLLSYVEEAQETKEIGESYGFQRTTIDSIFDKVPFYRPLCKYVDEKRAPNDEIGISAPEYCMKHALENCDDIRTRFDIYREVPLALVDGIETDDPEIKEYIENGARFDFVIAKEDKIYAIIEVDGAYHRSDIKTLHNDELKNRAVKSMGNDFFKKQFIRIATNGTSMNELDFLCKALCDTESVPIINHFFLESKQMVEYFNRKMEQCAAIIQEHIHNGELDNTLKEILRATGYQNPTETNYHYDDPLFNAVYLIKYGYAYAFEYSTIYQIIMEDYENDVFGVTCFGCGSCIDAWSLAYVKNMFQRDISIKYAGTDLNTWEIQFKPEHGNEMELAYSSGNGSIGMHYPGTDNMQRDILDFLNNANWQYHYNTILFSKILNELSDDVLSDLVDCFRSNANRFRADRSHYVVISHSKDKYERHPAMRTIAQRICEAINHDNRFSIDDKLPLNWNGLTQGRNLADVSDEGNYACYEFPKDQNNYYDPIQQLNGDFAPTEEVENVYEIINPFLSHAVVRRTSTSLFQIIKLTPIQGAI